MCVVHRMSSLDVQDGDSYTYIHLEAEPSSQSPSIFLKSTLMIKRDDLHLVQFHQLLYAAFAKRGKS